MWHSTRAQLLARLGAFCVATVLLLFIMYQPARQVFRSTGDVALYQRYARLALASPPALPREYPPASALIFVVPQLIAPSSYPLVFALLAALAVWLLVVVVDRSSGRGWWLLLYLALGAIGTLFFRFDIFVVLLTVLAYAAAQGRRWYIAQALLALGVALKLYPVILMPLVAVWQWRDTGRFPWSGGAAAAALLALALGSMWWIAPEQTAGMLRYHRDRPLEFESIGASIAWLIGPVRARWSFGSFNLESPLSRMLIPALTVANIALLAAVYLSFLRGSLKPAAAWALTLLAAIATSKVFSTQYVLWALPFLVLATEGNMRWRLFWLWAGICVVTSLIYPVAYSYYEPTLTNRRPPAGMMWLVTLRNTLWLIGCIAACRAWYGQVAAESITWRAQLQPRSRL
jgi:hypothetical protein